MSYDIKYSKEREKIVMENNQTPQQTQIPQGATKNCKHCKSIIPKVAKICPICRKKQGGIGKWIIIAVVVLVIIGALGSGGNTENTKPVANTDQSPTNTKASTETDAPTSKSDTDTTSENVNSDKTTFSTGETWENKYMKVNYLECGNYTDYNEYFPPADGKKVVYATFEFENVSSSDQVAMYTDFTCYADGYSCDGYYYADDSGFSQTLSAGRKCTGTVYFEVPVEATDIEFEYDVNFWTSENIVFIYSE